MTEQKVVVPMLEGAYSFAEALMLRHTAVINGIECRVLLPGPPHNSIIRGSGPLEPPYDEHHQPDPGWPHTRWGVINTSGTVTIRAIGLLLIGSTITDNEELVDFDLAVGRWKRLLRDWLAVLAAGPTDFLERTRGETIWSSSDHAHTLQMAAYFGGDVHFPELISAWEWNHALAHATKGDEPPLARTLLTTAARAAAIGDWRLAVIDAATAAEVALTTGLTSRLSTQAASHVVEALVARTRMLGPRLDLARDLGMALPQRVQADLLQPRNAVVHRGDVVTETHAQSAIRAARDLIDEYEPLAVHCQEPRSDHS